ncbi:dnaa protein helix-turn-helix [Caudoviricetes sp.]|nr:dnaa protein helix-turn-helix [Caudoviricetes sp.]
MQTAEELIAHYAAVRARIRRTKPGPVPVLVTLPRPPKPLEPAPVSRPKAPNMDLPTFLAQIKSRQLPASPANAIRLAALLDRREGFEEGTVIGKGRKYQIASVRFEFYWHLIHTFGWAYAQAGRNIGRDHTSILHGTAKYESILRDKAASGGSGA